MSFNQDVDEAAAAAKAAKSNWKGYLVAAAAGAVAVLIVIGLFKFIL